MAEAVVWLDGALLRPEEAAVPVGDAGVAYGYGAFETLRTYNGRPFLLERHLRRLVKGAAALGLPNLWGETTAAEAVAQAIEACGAPDAYVRITILAGQSPSLQLPTTAHLAALVRAYDGYPRDLYERGMAVVIAPWPRNERSPLCHVKSVNYLENLLARQYAHERGAGEALLVNLAGHIAEGSATNVFVVESGEVITPPLGDGALPGITREVVFELCRATSIALREEHVLVERLQRADEVFLTNSLMELMPVSSVDGHTIGPIIPGPVTQRLLEAYRALTRRFR